MIITKLIALVWAVVISVVVAIIIPICCVTVLLNGFVLGDWCDDFWGKMAQWIRKAFGVIRDVIRS